MPQDDARRGRHRSYPLPAAPGLGRPVLRMPLLRWERERGHRRLRDPSFSPLMGRLLFQIDRGPTRMTAWNDLRAESRHLLSKMPATARYRRTGVPVVWRAGDWWQFETS